MKQTALFVCFSGIDGSGKTTCAHQMVSYLHGQGRPTRYVWLNTRPILLTPLRWLTRKTFLRGADMRTDYEAYHWRRRQSAARWQVARKVYYGVMFLDYLIWVYWNVAPYFLRGVNIVCDRYIYDLAVNLGDILGYAPEQESRLIEQLQRWLPKPSHVLICDVDEQIALARKPDTPDLSYLAAHRPRYRRIAEAFGFPVLDASGPLEAVMAEVRQIIDGDIRT